MLDVSEAVEKVAHARTRWNELDDVYKAWFASSCAIILIRDPKFLSYTFAVKATKAPDKNLGILAGEILYGLRSALDYVAWQVFKAAGGQRGDRGSRSVYFPIVTDASKWDAAVRRKVPRSWPEVIAVMKDCQPFSHAVDDPMRVLLPVLEEIGMADRHVEPAMIVAGSLGTIANFIPAPDPYEYGVAIHRPGSFVRRRSHRVGLAPHIPQRRNTEAGPEVNGDTHGRADEYPSPCVMLRSEDGSVIEMDSIPRLIDHVDGIVGRFQIVPTPG